MRTLILYDSIGGNTEKVAKRIYKVIEQEGLDVTCSKLNLEMELNFYDYDLLFVGSPNIQWLPTPNMMGFLKKKLQEHRINGDILPCAPKKPNKYVICFTTYCGAHIGVEEALSVTQWMSAFFAHIGYTVFDKMYIVGEMRNFGQAKGWMDDKILEELNTLGVYGNIKKRPNENDLLEVEIKTKSILKTLQFMHRL